MFQYRNEHLFTNPATCRFCSNDTQVVWCPSQHPMKQMAWAGHWTLGFYSRLIHIVDKATSPIPSSLLNF